MKTLFKTFENIDEIVSYITGNMSEIQNRWSINDNVATADRVWFIKVEENTNKHIERGDFAVERGYGEKSKYVFTWNRKYYITKTKDTDFTSGTKRCSMYRIANAIVGLFSEALAPGQHFIFDIPCDGKGGYDIYSIKNVSGIIMAEFVRNSSKMNGDYTHEFGTKGTESWAMIEAWERFMRSAGRMEFDEDAAKEHQYTIGI